MILMLSARDGRCYIAWLYFVVNSLILILVYVKISMQMKPLDLSAGVFSIPGFKIDDI